MVYDGIFDEVGVVEFIVDVNCGYVLNEMYLN